MSNLLSELEAVVGLAGEDTADAPWLVDGDGAVVCNGEDVAWILTDKPDAAYIAALYNLFRTHLAEIAAAVRDAARYRKLDRYPAYIDSHPDAELGEGVAYIIVLPKGTSIYCGALGKTVDAAMSAREG